MRRPPSGRWRLIRSRLAASMYAIQRPAVLRDGAALRILLPVDAYLVCNVPLKAAPIIGPTRCSCVAAKAVKRNARAKCIALAWHRRCKQRLEGCRPGGTRRNETKIMFAIQESANRDDPLRQSRLRVEFNYVI